MELGRLPSGSDDSHGSFTHLSLNRSRKKKFLLEDSSDSESVSKSVVLVDDEKYIGGNTTEILCRGYSNISKITYNEDEDSEEWISCDNA